MGEILERDVELGAIARQLDRAVEGDGSLIVVEGPAGIGKTTLLREAIAMAQERGMSVLQAKGGILEQRLEYGIVRQLIERPLLTADERRRADLLRGPAAGAAGVLGLGEPPQDAGPVQNPMLDILHSLHWVVANLAEEGPLLLVVDDAQWGDAASLLAGGYLARRLAGLRVAFIVGVRSDEPGRQAQILGEQLRAVEPVYMQLAPFSEGAAGQVLTGAFGGERPADDVIAACLSASGGNPFFLTELAADLAGSHDSPAELRPAAVGEAGPPAVRRSLLLRLGQLGPGPRGLAEALATLGGEGELRHAAAIAGLETDEAAAAADTLAVAGILEAGHPLRMIHPLVRAAVNDDMSPSELAAAHRRALEVLAADGAADEALLPHALEAAPRGDGELVALLARTSERALRTGAPDTAAVHLRRALAEPPEPEERPAVLAYLGRAEIREGEFDRGVEHLDEALALIPPDERGFAIHRDRAFAAFAASGIAESRRVVAEALNEVDQAGGMQLEADLALLAWLSGGEHDLDLSRYAGVGGATRAERSILALLSQERWSQGAPAEEVAELAQRALAGGRLIAEDTGEALHWYLAVYSLLGCEALVEARATIEEALADGRRRGSAFTVAGALGARAVLALSEGRPADAEVDARTAAAGAIPPVMAPVNSAYLVLALTDQGDLAAADAELRAGGIDEGPSGPTVQRWIPWSRARLREAQGRGEEARASLQPLIEDDEAGRPMRALAWRALLARVQVGAGDEASQLAADHLAWAEEWGRPAALGVAQRANALTASGDERVAALEAAAVTLADSALRTEEARARGDLGVALLRTGRRSDGQRELSAALELALDCGARGIARAAADELEVAGAAPQKLRFDELTASERRVATMAADGQTNREIAEELFVSPKTVENHLTRVYAKLGVNSRRSLAGAL